MTAPHPETQISSLRPSFLTFLLSEVTAKDPPQTRHTLPSLVSSTPTSPFALSFNKRSRLPRTSSLSHTSTSNILTSHRLKLALLQHHQYVHKQTSFRDRLYGYGRKETAMMLASPSCYGMQGRDGNVRWCEIGRVG